MTEIIGVKFKSGGKQYYFDPNGLTVNSGQGVIVETGKGLEYGICSRPNGFVEDTAVVQPLRPVVRLATDEDKQTMAELSAREKAAFQICQEKIEKHGLDMKLVSVEYAFDGSKVLFFFTSDGRVDFRALVKDLASTLRTRIELRQIGVRDEARMLGGLGICGKPFCCSQFLNEFQPVSIKMAKTQSLSLNPTKISGTCGRLMCCLKYEQDAYEDAVRRCPKNESFVECPDGVGTISSVNLLREQVKVKLEESTEPPKSYRVDEIRVVRSGKGKRPDNYVAPPPSELEKLRFIPLEEDKPLPRHSNDRLAAALESILSGKAMPSAEYEQTAPTDSPSHRRENRGGRGGKKAPAAKPAPKPGKKAQKSIPSKPKPPKQDAPKASRPDSPENMLEAAEKPSRNFSKKPYRRYRPRPNGGKKPPNP